MTSAGRRRTAWPAPPPHDTRSRNTRSLCCEPEVRPAEASAPPGRTPK
jgi:hypothetical protein